MSNDYSRGHDRLLNVYFQLLLQGGHFMRLPHCFLHTKHVPVWRTHPGKLLYCHRMLKARNGPLCKLRTTQALVSLRICAGWPGPSLSAHRISGYYSICRRTENAQIRLHRCARWSGPTLSANCIRALFVLCAPNEITMKPRLWFLFFQVSKGDLYKFYFASYSIFLSRRQSEWRLNPCHAE